MSYAYAKYYSNSCRNGITSVAGNYVLLQSTIMDLATPPKKPSWFRIYDLLTIGLGAIASIFCLIYVYLHKIKTPYANEGIALLSVVALTFLGIYLVYLLQRRSWLNEFTWLPEYGLMVHLGEYRGANKSDLRTETERTINAWAHGIVFAKHYLLLDVTWIFFERGLNTSANLLTGRKTKGFVISGTRLAYVDFDYDEPLNKTAYSHELGHIIYGNSSKLWDEKAHHEYMSKHNLV